MRSVLNEILQGRVINDAMVIAPGERFTTWFAAIRDDVDEEVYKKLERQAGIGLSGIIAAEIPEARA